MLPANGFAMARAMIRRKPLAIDAVIYNLDLLSANLMKTQEVVGDHLGQCHKGLVWRLPDRILPPPVPLKIPMTR